MPKDKRENAEFYQIRLDAELKEEFMRSCHEKALNPSAVLRMLMTQWTAANREANQKKASNS